MTSKTTRHYPGHFGEFSGFSMMNFYTTTHSITTNVIDLERTRRAASNGTPMSTLKMKLQGIMTLQTYEKNRIKNCESTGALQSICLLKDMFGKATAAQVYSRSTPAVCPDFSGASRAFVLWVP